MNEDILVNSELSEEFVEVPGESSLLYSNPGENVVESDSDSGSDSGSVLSDESGSDSSSVVMPETHFSYELGGYPVVIVNDVTGVEPIADYYDYYTTMSDAWITYYSGVLANMGDTDYVAYCLRDYANSSYSSYTDHFVMYYDLEVENGSLVAGNYPYMDIYRESNSSGYICNTGTAAFSSVPFPAYGSFGNLSDIREGVTHDETWAVLFAIGFAVVYSVCHDIFDYVMHLRK